MLRTDGPLQEIWAVLSLQTVQHTAPALLVVVDHLYLSTTKDNAELFTWIKPHYTFNNFSSVQCSWRNNAKIIKQMYTIVFSQLTFLVLGLFRDALFPGRERSKVNFKPSPVKSQISINSCSHQEYLHIFCMIMWCKQDSLVKIGFLFFSNLGKLPVMTFEVKL